jgi:D-arabinose 1-dehydrogenase-like Zn-dependent alcohol dehydrogenase
LWLCHSDLQATKGGKKKNLLFLFIKEFVKRPPLPLIVGHEGIGDHVTKGDIIAVQLL